MTDQKKLTLKTLNEDIADVKRELNDVITVLNAMAETIATPIKEEEGTEVTISLDDVELNSAEENREKQIEMDNTDIASRIPPAWRDIIDTELGDDFEAKFEDGGTGQNFVLFLTLPKHLDRRPINAKDGSRDISTGAINRATDVSDVETLCKLVKGNIQKTYPDFKKDK